MKPRKPNFRNLRKRKIILRLTQIWFYENARWFWQNRNIFHMLKTKLDFINTMLSLKMLVYWWFGILVNEKLSIVLKTVHLKSSWQKYNDLPPITPSIWAQSPDSDPQTTNGAESYPSHLNEQFYTAHPNIYIFVEILLRRQTTNYVAMTMTSLWNGRTTRKASLEKQAYLKQAFTEYTSAKISRIDYMQRVAYLVCPTI